MSTLSEYLAAEVPDPTSDAPETLSEPENDGLCPYAHPRCGQDWACGPCTDDYYTDLAESDDDR